MRSIRNPDLAISAAVVVAAGLIVVPVLSVVVGTWPIQMDELTWRMAAAGGLFGTLMTPVLGLGILVALALVTASRRAAPVLGVLCGVLSMGLLLIAAVFLLDVLQLRGTAAQPLPPQVVRASLFSAGSGIVGIVGLLFLSLAAFRCAPHRNSTTPARAGRSGSNPISGAVR